MVAGQHPSRFKCILQPGLRHEGREGRFVGQRDPLDVLGFACIRDRICSHQHTFVALAVL